MFDGTTMADTAPTCPTCGTAFSPKRKNQRYCAKTCAKKATRNATRGDRKIENSGRTGRHYERAAWLAFDLNRMSPVRQRKMLLALLEAASGRDAALRNILLDPALLGAERLSPRGKLYPDTKSSEALNIAKMVHAFCRAEWGCSTRDAILDNKRPARRMFREEAAAKVPPHCMEVQPSGCLSGPVDGGPVPISAVEFFRQLVALRADRPLPPVTAEGTRPRHRHVDAEADHARIEAEVKAAQAAVERYLSGNPDLTDQPPALDTPQGHGCVGRG